ncbi:MAG: metallophosphoesterase family protein [Promethearchaeota archaeon]
MTEKPQKVGLISDTHIPVFAKALPEKVIHIFKNNKVSLIIHAGDLVSLTVIDELNEIAPAVLAVHGNMDSIGVATQLPEINETDILGHKIGVIHGSGGPQGFIEKVEGIISGKDYEIVVCGHLHNAFVEKKFGRLFVNPGSPTDKRWAERNTVGILEITSQEVNPKIIEI